MFATKLIIKQEGRTKNDIDDYKRNRVTVVVKHHKHLLSNWT
jgi:hypothetical protein